MMDYRKTKNSRMKFDTSIGLNWLIDIDWLSRLIRWYRLTWLFDLLTMIRKNKNTLLGPGDWLTRTSDCRNCYLSTMWRQENTLWRERNWNKQFSKKGSLKKSIMLHLNIKCICKVLAYHRKFIVDLITLIDLNHFL